MGRMNIFGVGVDNITINEAVEKVMAWAESKNSLNKPHLVATVNTEFIMRAQKDAEFKKILNSADLAVPDGVGIVWASRLLSADGHGFSERVAGADLMEAICRRCAKNNVLAVFFGGKPGVAEKAAERLRKRSPGLLTEIWEAGEVGEEGEEGEEGGVRGLGGARRLRELGRRGEGRGAVIFVALGMGKQEKWIKKHQDELEKSGIKVAMGVGGSFDYLAGTIKRAPKLMQQLNLEWLWRLLLEPKRWRRQLALVEFGLAVSRNFWRPFLRKISG